MSQPVVFPYKVYRTFPCPIIPLSLGTRRQWVEAEAYVDSGASVSLFSVIEAQRLRLDLRRGRLSYSQVGDGSFIPVYLHTLSIRIGDVRAKAVIGFSPRLGVGFNLLGRRDIFTHFDITFSDATRTITFQPRP